MKPELIQENCTYIQRKLKVLENKVQHDPMVQLFLEEIAEWVEEIQKEVQVEPEHNHVHEIINHLERQAEEYGEQRMVQFSAEDANHLRNALAVPRGAR